MFLDISIYHLDHRYFTTESSAMNRVSHFHPVSVHMDSRSQSCLQAPAELWAWRLATFNLKTPANPSSIYGEQLCLQEQRWLKENPLGPNSGIQHIHQIYGSVAVRSNKAKKKEQSVLALQIWEGSQAVLTRVGHLLLHIVACRILNHWDLLSI